MPKRKRMGAFIPTRRQCPGVGLNTEVIQNPSTVFMQIQETWKVQNEERGNRLIFLKSYMLTMSETLNATYFADEVCLKSFSYIFRKIPPKSPVQT